MKQTIEELILKEIGGDGMEASQKQEMLDDIAESVQNYFIAFCYQKLSEEDKVQLEQLIDAGDDAAQDEFLKTKLVNHADILQQAVDQTIKDIKESQAELDEELEDLDVPPAPIVAPAPSSVQQPVSAMASPAPAPQLVQQQAAPPAPTLQPVAPPVATPGAETIAQQVPSSTFPVSPAQPPTQA